MRAGLALGSNVGDPLANLKAARAQIEQLPGVTPPLLASKIYETEPVDCEPGAAPFFNAVVEIGFDAEPPRLLAELRQIERQLGRPSVHPRNVSRIIDLDLLYIGDLRIDTPELRLPHPRMHERAFVLQPLADIRPELVLPKQRQSVRELLLQLGDTSQLVRVAAQW
ncbi:MAG: 2-amino-4-hydroxy-6-hydroxymethyldihydropteridinepyrophosphokinase [uncultured Chthoniobacterales bacterium]|uniref:2-amino-4-hydroxy-6-hydroxymethyldihydropteridine pyrophosphokinase n=1 Tax=uncultured Chthoniobacterales bacterium TaxID=1836801 RepID=A0A6J4HAC3_9BACT|nr:MAG: 2-amino-4-hydroxy-6-hydroxymethyldihydropteridinepyrophosphokinase [uncultured Chthoniobacterales bacterium]